MALAFEILKSATLVVKVPKNYLCTSWSSICNLPRSFSKTAPRSTIGSKISVSWRLSCVLVMIAVATSLNQLINQEWRMYVKQVIRVKKNVEMQLTMAIKIPAMPFTMERSTCPTPNNIFAQLYLPSSQCRTPWMQEMTIPILELCSRLDWIGKCVVKFRLSILYLLITKWS